MTVQVADIMAHMAALAPPDLAEDWDNCGLQVGDRRWPVQRILVALDPLPGVVEEACENEIDLLITHHPLLMRPLKQLDDGTRSLVKALNIFLMPVIVVLFGVARWQIRKQQRRRQLV